MGNIMDYLDWRGDLSFDVSPFNEVDNYIISKICTPDFRGFIPMGKQTVRLKDALERYLRKNDGNEYIGALASPMIFPVLRKMTETVRFGDLLVSGYVNRIEKKETEQFSALTVTLAEGLHYISFRGTDDTLVAWKENILMSVESTVRAREDAAAYLRWAAEKYEGRFYVGGHSKGGNLAVYAAASADNSIRKRILKVYSNDGPGFLPEFFEEEGYRAIRDRVVTIMPQHSIVGALLDQDENVEVVGCSKAGPRSHDGFLWEVCGPSFVQCPSLTRDTEIISTGLDRVLDGMDEEEKRAVISEIFDILKATGVSTLTDMAEHKLKQASGLISSLKSSPETKKFLSELIDAMIDEAIPPIRKPDFRKAVPKLGKAASKNNRTIRKNKRDPR